ncbi:MAG: DNA repair protein, partial [Candidatus Hydrogenedentota bacterium]
EAAQEAQEEGQEQFKDALEQFQTVLNFDGGDLEKEYNRLNDALSRSEAKAKSVNDSIDKVEDVAKALFKEWEQELTQYNNAEFKRESERQLSETKTRYTQVIGAMRRAESKIEPVLVPFRDQVLFLKHNLNARAIASLQNELESIESDVAALIREMEQSINEANAFIQSMGT